MKFLLASKKCIKQRQFVFVFVFVLCSGGARGLCLSNISNSHCKKYFRENTIALLIVSRMIFSGR
jgi:hypothetical protein